jgi:hypothetical protein
MNIKKFIGWLIFAFGLAIIFFGLYPSYNIFTGKTSAPEIFELTEEEAVLPGGSVSQQVLLEAMMQEQFSKMIPVNTIPTLLNLVCWCMLAMILIFGGAQISTLGIKLTKAD